MGAIRSALSSICSQGWICAPHTQILAQYLTTAAVGSTVDYLDRESYLSEVWAIYVQVKGRGECTAPFAFHFGTGLL